MLPWQANGQIAWSGNGLQWTLTSKWMVRQTDMAVATKRIISPLVSNMVDKNFEIC